MFKDVRCQKSPCFIKNAINNSYFFFIEAIVFTGDTLFQGSVRRTDLDGGSMFQLINSLRELAQLPDDTKVYPGHGDPTTIGFEVAHNPYMDR